MLDVVRVEERGHAHDRLQTHSPLRGMQLDELCCGVFFRFNSFFFSPCSPRPLLMDALTRTITINARFDKPSFEIQDLIDKCVAGYILSICAAEL